MVDSFRVCIMIRHFMFICIIILITHPAIVKVQRMQLIKQIFNIHIIHMKTAVTKHALFPVQLQTGKGISGNALDAIAEEMANCLI